MVQIVRPSKSLRCPREMVGHAENPPAARIALSRNHLVHRRHGLWRNQPTHLEVWVPAQHTYRVISKLLQLRRFPSPPHEKARFKDEEGKNRLLHTLNGSAWRLGRTSKWRCWKTTKMPMAASISPPALQPDPGRCAEFNGGRLDAGPRKPAGFAKAAQKLKRQPGAMQHATHRLFSSAEKNANPPAGGNLSNLPELLRNHHTATVFRTP